MKIKVSLHDATKYLAAGLKVEHYLIVDGEETEDEEKPKRKKKRLITRDHTQYRLTPKKADFTEGSYMRKVYDAILVITNKDPTRVFTRKQITDREGYENKVLSAIANLREGGYIKIVGE